MKHGALPDTKSHAARKEMTGLQHTHTHTHTQKAHTNLSNPLPSKYTHTAHTLLAHTHTKTTFTYICFASQTQPLDHVYLQPGWVSPHLAGFDVSRRAARLPSSVSKL